MDGKGDDRQSDLMRMIMESAEGGNLEAAVFLSESFRDESLIPEYPEDPYKVDIPEDLRERVEKVCEMAGRIESRRVCRRSMSFRSSRYEIGRSDADGEKVPALVDVLKILLERGD